MKLKLLSLGFLAAVLTAVSWAPTSHALGLKIAPLEYKTSLKKDESQRGFIDVSNPSGQAVHVKTSVQAFKQVDSNGGLQFYDDERIANGIRTDLTQFDLGPREALRMSFAIDGKALPEGDVYAAIFFTTDLAVPHSGVGQLVRVGTILSIVNATPGERSAAVTDVNMPFLQLSDVASGTYKVKNTGSANSGFYPEVSVSEWPGEKRRNIESSLVFGGRERQNDFSLPTGFGIHYIKVSYESSEKGTWVVVLAPSMLIVLVMILLIVGIELLLYKKRRKSGRKKTVPTP